MSCDAVAFSAALFLNSMSPANAPPPQLILATTTQAAPASVAHEPLFQNIVSRARALRGQVETYRRAGGAAPAASLPGYVNFRLGITQLAALDMQGHTLLAQRNTDGDLKCILRGISQDLNVRLEALESASTPAARATALRDMSYLLNDNVEVITSPPAPAA